MPHFTLKLLTFGFSNLNTMKQILFILCLCFCTFLTLLAQKDTLVIAREYSSKDIMGVKIVKSGNKFGVQNDTGKMVMPFHFDEIKFFGKRDSSSCTHWACVVQVRNGKNVGLADGMTGKGLTPLQYDELIFIPEICTTSVPEERVVISKIKNKFGLVSLKGEELIACNYEGIRMLTDRDKKICNPAVAVVDKAGKFGFMIVKTKQIVPATYDDVQFFQEIPPKGKFQRMLMLSIKQKGKIGIFNLHSDHQIPTEYDMIEVFDTKNELAVARKNNKFGVIDYKGKAKIDFSYEFADGIREGTAIFKKGKKFGLMNVTDKKNIIPFDFDEMSFLVPSGHKNAYFSQLILAQKGKKQGIMTTENKIIVPIEFDKIILDESKFGVKAIKDGKEEFRELR